MGVEHRLFSPPKQQNIGLYNFREQAFTGSWLVMNILKGTK